MVKNGDDYENSVNKSMIYWIFWENARFRSRNLPTLVRGGRKKRRLADSRGQNRQGIAQADAPETQ
jgi:hypothetical protein